MKRRSGEKYIQKVERRWNEKRATQEAMGDGMETTAPTLEQATGRAEKYSAQATKRGMSLPKR
jgi:hypothetical protein